MLTIAFLSTIFNFYYIQYSTNFNQLITFCRGLPIRTQNALLEIRLSVTDLNICSTLNVFLRS